MIYTLTVHLTAKSDPECIRKLKNKLVEASRVYSQDRETVSWLVMQSVSDQCEFTIVERYEKESEGATPSNYYPWLDLGGHPLLDACFSWPLPLFRVLEAFGMEDSREVARNVFEHCDGCADIFCGMQSQQYHLNNPYWKTFDP